MANFCLFIFQESLKGPVVNSTLYDLVPATPRIKIHPAETEGGGMSESIQQIIYFFE